MSLCDFGSTGMTHLTFCVPSMSNRADVAAYRAEVFRCHADFDGSAGLGEFDNYARWLERLHLLSSERAKKYGFCKTVVRLAYCEDRLVGIFNVRLSKDTLIERYAGHIGYNIRPTERQKGFGRACTLEAVRLCAENGIANPVICTYPDNIASQRTAEAAGFVFAGIEKTDSGISIARYVKRE